VRLAAFLAFIFVVFAGKVQADPYTKPQLSAEASLSRYCKSNPYSCTSNGDIRQYDLDGFIETFYVEVDAFFASYGFEEAIIEFCYKWAKSVNCYAEETVARAGAQINYRMKHQIIGDSNYKISRVFPKARFWKESLADSGGIKFYKKVDPHDVSTYCEIPFEVDYAKLGPTSVFYRVTLPNLIEAEIVSLVSLETECVLIPGASGEILDLFYARQGLFSASKSVNFYAGRPLIWEEFSND
jgi:hypothetical protein